MNDNNTLFQLIFLRNNMIIIVYRIVLLTLAFFDFRLAKGYLLIKDSD